MASAIRFFAKTKLFQQRSSVANSFKFQTNSQRFKTTFTTTVKPQTSNIIETNSIINSSYRTISTFNETYIRYLILLKFTFFIQKE